MKYKYVNVRNKKSTAGNMPPLGSLSWLDFWEKKQRDKAEECAVIGCTGKAEVGGHVIKSGEGGRGYLLPMCYSCNNKPETEIFNVWEFDLASVR